MSFDYVSISYLSSLDSSNGEFNVKKVFMNLTYVHNDVQESGVKASDVKYLNGSLPSIRNRENGAIISGIAKDFDGLFKIRVS